MTVETELNGDSKSTNERGPSLVGSWACRASTGDFCPSLASLVGTVQNIFFPRRTLFKFICPHFPAIG